MYKIYQKLLDEKGLKNADVSRATGISNMTLSDWKRGKSTPKQDKIEQIAMFLGVDSKYLRGVSPTTQCPDCGFNYDLFNQELCSEHERIHHLMENAKKKYGFYYNSEYCMYHENADINTLCDTTGGLLVSTKISAYEDYVKCCFCEDLRKNSFIFKYESFENYIRNHILEDKHSNFMSVELFEELCKKYKIDSSYTDDNAKLLANIQRNQPLMRLLKYAEKLTPEMLNMLEIQAKALAQENEKYGGDSDL
ncbi:helix-turn-helix transcriptional regulator [uncultured Eubacterium sp.]|uniref:helix-turn-helix domain-containing protein n=1 Tax=uncultured Eubacterium sp. TaxID=165185 RepID=UPI0032652A23